MCLYFWGRLPPTGERDFLLSILIIITHGLQVDGLVKTLDGTDGRRGKGERLRVMRESHIGTVGVIGLVLIFMAKYLLIGN